MPTKKARPLSPTGVKKLTRLRRQRDDAVTDANIARRMGRTGQQELALALKKAIEIDKIKGYY